ncbi:HYR domain-containing protein, partial [Algibacter sp.]|uniref:HYR domain-containing protein n=1 Tax=Algibacter sp. TaxID=1872428 RepID=UPI003C77674F
ITWTVTDINNNDAVAVTQTVTVTDDELPEITASAGITHTADLGECGAMVTIVDATATDNCSVGVVTGTRDDTLALNALYPVGTTTITWTVTDINNNDAVAVTQTVTVTDNELPEITASAGIIQTADLGECGAMVTIIDATATDNCSVGLVTGTRDDGEVLTALYPVGTTTITWTVTDINNNDAVAVTQTVTVTDDELPEIICSSDISLNASSASGAEVTYTEPVGTDNCPNASTTLLTTQYPSGATFPIGDTVVTYKVTDSANNFIECSFIVSITETVTGVAPVIDCPADISVINDVSECGAVVDFVATDSVGNPTSTITYDIQPGTFFNVGSTTVNATATNSVGTSSCSFEVTVTNTIPNNTGGVIAGLDPIQAGTGFSLSANFNDDNLTSATWYFSSDGNLTGTDTAEYSQVGTIAGGVVSGTFNFDATQTGVYTVKVIVTDACNETAEVTLSTYVVVYDPSGGFVTGGGWIDSPDGALAGTNTVGKANFGLVAKYKTGKNNVLTLDGNTNFQFKEGDLHFKSSVYDEMSLVISGGKKATYRGVGTVNRSGSHKFLVTVIDGDATGGDGDDKFRIKIWADGSSSDVVYDNEFSSEENADSSTILGGGSIVIHKPKGKNKSKGEAIKAEPLEAEIFDGLELVSWPNPSDDYFNIKLKSKNTVDKINIHVFDLNGRLISFKTGVPNRDYKIGASLQAGLYFINVIQGNTSKQVKLIKY